jgi:hypothetical protein
MFDRPRDPSTDPERRRAKDRRQQFGEIEHKFCLDCNVWFDKVCPVCKGVASVAKAKDVAPAYCDLCDVFYPGIHNCPFRK